MKWFLIVIICLTLLRLLFLKIRGLRTAGEGKPLVRDPVCGAYVQQDSRLSCKAGRKRFYFCSPRCRTTFTEGRS